MLGGRRGCSRLGRVGGQPPHRKLSSTSARSPKQSESGSCSTLGSDSTQASSCGSASASSWGSRGLSQEMVEDVLTSFRVELEEGGE